MCVSCLRRSGTARNTPLRSIVCGPCWFAGGGDISPSELSTPTDSDLDSITAALAVETLLPRTALEWYRGLLSSTWYQQIRRDAAGRLCGLLTELGLRADWDTHTSWPTWERLQEASGWRRSSTASWLAELQRQGWLLRVEGGSTPRYRPMALQHLSGNRAAVYQLRVPAQDAAERDIPTLPTPDTVPADSPTAESSKTETWTPTHPPKDLSKTSTGVPTRASTRIHSSQLNTPSRRENGPDGPGQEEKQGSHFDRRVPVTNAEMLAAAAELRTDPAIRRLTPRWIRAIVRSWWHAGWTNNDLRFALEHHPSTTGRARPVDRCPAAQLRRPDGWLRHRLSTWCDAHGPLISPAADHRQRRDTASTHGRAAADRLPYGATALSPTDVAATSSDRDTAHSQLVRRWAREFHAQRNATRPDNEVADSHTRQRHYRRISEQLDEGRASATHPSAPAIPERTTDTTPAPTAEPGPATAHDRALARARAEREPGPRSLPRRFRPRRFR